jgi:hypothetical protein
MLVKPFHKGDGEDVVGGPEAGNDGLGAGEEESAFETGDSFLAEEFAGAGFAGGKDDEIGAKGKIADLADLEKAVVA